MNKHGVFYALIDDKYYPLVNGQVYIQNYDDYLTDNILIVDRMPYNVLDTLLTVVCKEFISYSKGSLSPKIIDEYYSVLKRIDSSANLQYELYRENKLNESFIVMKNLLSFMCGWYFDMMSDKDKNDINVKSYL